MKKSHKFWMAHCVVGTFAAMAVFPRQAPAATITLCTAGNYAIVGGSTVIYSSPSVVDGETEGVNLSLAITGGLIPGCNIFQQVGNSTTPGTAAFQGHILALTSITAGATLIGGSGLAVNGPETLDINGPSRCNPPEPATVTFDLIGGALLLIWRVKIRRH